MTQPREPRPDDSSPTTPAPALDGADSADRADDEVYVRADGSIAAPETVASAVAPQPDDPRKPASPTDLGGPAVRYALRRTIAEFQRDQCTDLAAALVYYSVLSIVPALAALVSLLGVAGDPEVILGKVLTVVEDLASEDVVETIRPVLEQVTQSSAAGWAFVVGLVLALWSASGYVIAFSRAANRIYGVEEGRPLWVLRPWIYALTVALLVMVALVALTIVASGDVVRAVGALFGDAESFARVWDVVRWPVVAVLVVVLVAALFYGTPNVRQPRVRWLSPGAVLGIVVWVLASVGFGVYVSNFASYNSTYGTLAGVVIFLLWLWIGNLALLLGVQLDAELERARQLRAGIAAEERLQVKLRGTSALDKRAQARFALVEAGRRLRLQDAPGVPGAQDGNEASSSRDARG